MILKATADLSDVTTVFALPDWCMMGEPVPLPEWDDFYHSLSVRAWKTLDVLQVQSFEQAARLTRSKLNAVRNCGETTIRELERRLREYGVDIVLA